MSAHAWDCPCGTRNATALIYCRTCRGSAQRGRQVAVPPHVPAPPRPAYVAPTAAPAPAVYPAVRESAPVRAWWHPGWFVFGLLLPPLAATLAAVAFTYRQRQERTWTGNYQRYASMLLGAAVWNVVLAAWWFFFR